MFKGRLSKVERCRDGTAQDSNQIYYTQWICNLLEEGEEDVRIHFEEDKDSEIAKKLAIVRLYCIQSMAPNRSAFYVKVVVQILGVRIRKCSSLNPKTVAKDFSNSLKLLATKIFYC